MSRTWAARASAAIVMAGLTVIGCATNPVTGKREFSLISSSQEQQLGAEGYKAVIAEYGLYADQREQSYVDSVGQAVARGSHEPGMRWRFTVVDDPAVNAFAMPGGYIYVTRGILAHLNSEAQLAGVLGHEAAHVTARHSAQQITQAQLANLGLGIASVLSPGFQRFSGAASQALGLLFLKYGRDHENLADELGIQYATKAGYDPREVPPTYSMLKRVGERSGQRLPTFLSTHPDPGDRETRTTGLARTAAGGRTGLAVRQRAYLLRQDGIVFGQDPRQGYFEGDRYYHPTLAFSMTFPAGWKKQDTKSAILAAEPNDRAAMQVTLVPGNLSPTAYVQQLESEGRIAAARGGPETIGGFPAWVGRLTVNDQSGAPAVLVAVILRKSSQAMFQILGRSANPGDSDEERILSAATSFRALTDQARLNPTPDQLDVVSVTRASDFATAVRSFGTQALNVEDTAILNNANLDDDVRPGELIKIVRPGRRR
jgi:predicted Zn-dependent protease